MTPHSCSGLLRKEVGEPQAQGEVITPWIPGSVNIDSSLSHPLGTLVPRSSNGPLSQSTPSGPNIFVLPVYPALVPPPG